MRGPSRSHNLVLTHLSQEEASFKVAASPGGGEGVCWVGDGQASILAPA